MAQTFKWGTIGGSLGTVTGLSTELNSLTNGSVTALGTEIDNTTAQDQTAFVAVHMASAAFTSGANIQIGIVPSTDLAAAAYPTVDSTNIFGYTVAIVYIQGTTAAHDETCPYPVTIPPGKWKVVAMTQGCPTLAASGNTVKFIPVNSQAA